MIQAMSLKAKIRNIAKDKNIPAQVILQNYMFERLLVRLSMSEYKEKFVLKGGMLVAAMVGPQKSPLNARSNPRCTGGSLQRGA